MYLIRSFIENLEKQTFLLRSWKKANEMILNESDKLHWVNINKGTLFQLHLIPIICMAKMPNRTKHDFAWPEIYISPKCPSNLKVNKDCTYWTPILCERPITYNYCLMLGIDITLIRLVWNENRLVSHSVNHLQLGPTKCIGWTCRNNCIERHTYIFKEDIFLE